MQICDETHKEICFEGKYCPVCPIVEELEDSKKEIDSLQKELSGLNTES